MEMAILHDTLFLSKCNIMDYSLLVGINQKTHEMAIGIVGNIKKKKKLPKYYRMIYNRNILYVKILLERILGINELNPRVNQHCNLEKK